MCTVIARIPRICAAILSLLLMCGAQGASAPASPDLIPARLPPEAVYGILFNEIAAFTARADVLQKEGKSAGFLRTYHRNRFNLSESLYAKLRDTALRCAAEIADVDRRAYAIIAETKRKYRNAPRGVLVPPPPKELLDLEEERREKIREAVGRLAQAFGPAHFAWFEAELRRYAGTHLRRKAEP